MLNSKSFLKNSLFYDDGYQNIGTIIDNVSNKNKITTNLKYAYKYAKISNTFINIDKLKKMVSNDLLPYEVLLVAANNTSKLPYLLINNYLNKGGKIIFLKDLDPGKNFKILLGLKSYSKEPDSQENGFSVKTNFYMNKYSQFRYC